MKATLFLLFVGFGLLSPVIAEEDTPLGKEMDEMNSFYKQMRKTEDPVKGIEMAKKAQAKTLESLKYLPKMFEEVTDKKEKARLSADYRRMVGMAYVYFCEAELAFIEGDLTKVEEIVAKLRAIKKKAHKAYIKDE